MHAPGTNRNQQHAIIALRVVVALIMIVHGIARARLGIVDDFGGFLTSRGFPVGVQIAWAITLFEICGGIVLAWGRWVRALAVVFSLELAAGIVMVHMPEGWFVVGAGRNGMEYSVLLIAVMAAVAYATPAVGRGVDITEPASSPVDAP